MSHLTKLGRLLCALTLLAPMQASEVTYAMSIIAASAMVDGVPLKARSVDDFKLIAGLTLIDPTAP